MRLKSISSISNPLVKEALRIKERKGSPHDFLIEGLHLLETAVDAGAQISRVFFTDNYRSKSGVILKRISHEGCEFIETTEHVLSRLSDTETPQGVVAVVKYEVYDLASVSLGKSPMVVVCDGIQDPGNLGTVIRASDAFAAAAVILLPGTCDALAPKAVRATAGSIFNLPVLTLKPDRLFDWLRAETVRLVMTETNAPRAVYESDLLGPLALVLGNEARGVSEWVRRRADLSVSIPMPGKAESLNVATSAAICLYEAFRQRKLHP